MYTQTVSVKEARERLAEIIEQVAVAKKTYIVTKFGKPKVQITHLEKAHQGAGKRNALEAAFGIWADRKEMRNAAAWVAKNRAKWSRRHEQKID